MGRAAGWYRLFAPCVFPGVLSHLPESAVVVNGEYGLHEATFWMALHPVLLLSLIVTLIANWRHRYRRNMVAITLGVYVVVIVVSALYFIPELGRFASSPLKPEVTPAEWLERATLWLRLSWLRARVFCEHCPASPRPRPAA